MGVIKRQSLKFTVVNFVGTLIGFLSIIFVYPRHGDAYGLFQALIANAILITPFLGLGVHGLIVQFAPLFAKKNISSSLLAFSLYTATAVSICVSLLLLIGFYIFKDSLASLFANFELINEYKVSILILAYLQLYCGILVYVSMVNLRIVIPDIIYNLLLKIALPVMIICIIKGWIRYDQFHWVIIGYYLLILTAIGYYVSKLQKHSFDASFDKFSKAELKEMAVYALFVMLNGVGATLAVKIDQSMLSAMTSVAIVGTFTLVLTMVNIIDIPYKALSQIVSPIISKNWANNDIPEIRKIYRSSSLFGAAIGSLLFMLLYHSWVDIIGLMPGNKGGLTPVIAQSIFIALGLAKVFDISTGTNSHIMTYCGAFKEHMYSLVVMGCINVFLNYFLIGRYGMQGAAFATFTAVFVTNVFKYIFVRIKFGLNLNLVALLSIFGLAVLMIFGFYFIPFTFHPFVNLVLRGATMTIIFVLGIILIDPGNIFKEEGRKSLESVVKFVPTPLYNILHKLVS